MGKRQVPNIDGNTMRFVVDHIDGTGIAKD